MSEFIHTDKITYWARSTPNGFGGYSFAAPQVLAGRWEQKSELFRTPKGEELVSAAVAFLERDVTEGDYLFLGESVASDPLSVTGSMEVLRFVRIPGLRSLRTMHKALM